MYRAFSIKQLITAFGLLAVACFVALTFITPPPDIVAGIRLALAAPTFASILLAVAGSKVVFPWIWRLGWVQKLFFPYVNGVWSGEVTSNWPVHEKMREFAGDGRRKIDPGSVSVDSEPALKREVEVTIEASFFSFEATLRSVDDYQHSTTLVVQPQCRSEGQPARLFYFYQATVPIPKPTDAGSHHGAAKLDVLIDPNGEVSLKGHYWTDREWHLGNNTAGTLVLRRKA